MKKRFKSRLLAAFLVAALLLGCGMGSKKEDIEIQAFIAASLNKVMTELAEQYNRSHPNVHILCNADSSGKLLAQIQEGYACDIFFSADEKQMDQLEADGLLIEGTRADAVKNQLAVVALKGSWTKVTGLENIGRAKSIALAGAGAPVGKYTRQALIKLGFFDGQTEPSEITAKQVSEALGGVEISEQDNVSKALMAVIEGSCEVGTVYDSDLYGYEDKLDILQMVDCSLTGDVICPIARVVNEEAGDAQAKAADDFLSFVLSDEAKKIFEAYDFDVDFRR